MPKNTIPAVQPGHLPETRMLATAGQQMLLDAMMVEMGALKAMLPGLAPSRSDGQTPADLRRAADAAQDEMFDNMPV